MKGEIRYEVRSAYFHILLSRAAENGFVLFDIEKTGGKTHTFRISARQRKAFEAFLGEFHLETKVSEIRGMPHVMSFVRRHPAMFICAALAIAGIYFMSLRVWIVSSPDTRIKNALSDLGVRPGVRKQAISESYLSGALTALFPEYAHVGIRVFGVYLYADAYMTDPVPEVFTLSGARDLTALSDGVVLSVNVLSGSANVKAGDTVRKGDVLIRGEERSGKNGETHPVRAEGSVLARVWTQAESVCALQKEERRFTGREAYETHLKTPFFSKKLAGGSAFLLYETKSEETRVVGLFCPVTVEKRIFSEYETVFTALDKNQAVAAAEASALASARRLSPAGAKEAHIRTNISESGGFIRCEAVIEWILEIAYDKQGG